MRGGWTNCCGVVGCGEWGAWLGLQSPSSISTPPDWPTLMQQVEEEVGRLLEVVKARVTPQPKS